MPMPLRCEYKPLWGTAWLCSIQRPVLRCHQKSLLEMEVRERKCVVS